MHGDLLRQYAYSYDLAGNRVQQVETVAGSPTTTNYTYNAANQMTAAGGATLTYDDNGNLTSDGTNAYVWDRANRLLSVTEWSEALGGVSYAYDGLNNRVAQTISSTVTQYLLDLQPGLSVVLAATTGANTDRYVHGPRGIHAQRDAADNWEWMVQDGLGGSVRGVADASGAILWSGSYGPYGNDFDDVGVSQTPYGFTGEPTDANNLVHLRARYYRPNLGIFTALDPFEGMAGHPMSLNGYSWVEGNAPNSTDPSGDCPVCIVVIIAGGILLGGCNLQSEPEQPTQVVPPVSTQAGTSVPTSLALACAMNNSCTATPLAISTPGSVTPVPPAPTAIPSPLPTMPPASSSCPSDSLFGCYPGTANPILAAFIPGTHLRADYLVVLQDGHNFAADFVPENSGASNAYPDWEKSVAEYGKTVHAVVGGDALPLGNGSYRIRTDELWPSNTTYRVCYEYLHLEPIANVSPGAGRINAGQPLGIIQSHLIDDDPDPSYPPSHAHVAIWPCSVDDPYMQPATNERIDPMQVMNYTGGSS
ncbi:MAG: hypothetical protein KC547_06140 [Anaerolineae bacterium]|nr:hypothetical protein [Anaerolineae bacterium]